ncbi:hypothetical protein ACFLXH_04645 [Chloroflexota bacterium]
MRIGINVPNDLLKRMKPFKQMINISQVCRDAIEYWVNTYERASEKAKQDGMEEVAAVLSREWEPIEVDWQTIGHEDARIWAQKATPENFEHFAHNLKVGRSHGRTPGIWMAPHLPGTKTYGERQAEHEDWFMQQCELDWDTNPYLIAQEEYVRGWTSYLIAILDMAEKPIEETSVQLNK